MSERHKAEAEASGRKELIYTLPKNEKGHISDEISNRIMEEQWTNHLQLDHWIHRLTTKGGCSRQKNILHGVSKLSPIRHMWPA